MPKQGPTPKAPSSSSPGKDGKETGRGSWLGILGLLGITAVGLFATLFSVWFQSTPPSSRASLQIALDEYIAGRFEISEELALLTEVDPGDSTDAFRLREFLIGASGMQRGLSEPDSRQSRLTIDAYLPYLLALQRSGFPAGREGEGNQLLGIGLHLLGRFEEAVVPLEEAFRQDPTLQREMRLLLVKNSIRIGDQGVPDALAGIASLRAAGKLPPALDEELILLEAQAMLASKQWPAADALLDQLVDSPLRDQADLVRVERWIMEARDLIAKNSGDSPVKSLPRGARELLEDAVKLTDQIEYRGDLDLGPASSYLAALAHRLLGDETTALSILAGLRQNTRNPAEAIAASLEEVEILADQEQYGDCVSAIRGTIRQIGNPAGFDARWISLTDYRQRLQAIPVKMWEGQAFREAAEFSSALMPVVPEVLAQSLSARSYYRWAEQIEQAAKPLIDMAEVQQRRSEARLQYRQAGQIYATVARLVYTEPEYPDALWLAIEAYQRGGAFAKSLDLLEDYLRFEQRTLLPRGLIARGRALLATDRPKEALRTLTDCIAEYPRDALSSEASLLAAVAHLEVGEYLPARELLEANLYNGQLNPDNPVFRDSMFVLGETMYRQAYHEHQRLSAPSIVTGRLVPGVIPSIAQSQALADNQELLEEAIERFEEVILRDRNYGDFDRARHAMYLKACSQRMAVFWPTIQMGDPQTLEPTRRQLEQKRRATLQQSIASYSELKDTLLQRMAERGELEDRDHAMLRNCYMGIADNLYDLTDYPAAAEAYSKTAQEFLHEPIALQATLRESLCYERLGRSEDAKRLFGRAADILNRIPTEEDPEFAQTTLYARDEWKELIDWLGKS